jgi:hypothetical protein
MQCSLQEGLNWEHEFKLLEQNNHDADESQDSTRLVPSGQAVPRRNAIQCCSATAPPPHL